jgi:hypothetical protein
MAWRRIPWPAGLESLGEAGANRDTSSGWTVPSHRLAQQFPKLPRVVGRQS